MHLLMHKRNVLRISQTCPLAYRVKIQGGVQDHGVDYRVVVVEQSRRIAPSLVKASLLLLEKTTAL